ncbi:hypothetical protein N9T73_00100 [bacterium]|nr:hypothetical protein [bacterium]
MSNYYIINWESNNILKEDFEFDNPQNKFELCFNFEKKSTCRADFVNLKYNPNYILKYPININKDEHFKNGLLKINKLEFEKILIKYNLVNVYLSECTYNKNEELIKKININTNCNINICNIFSKLSNYNNIKFNIDSNCNGKNCNKISLIL